MKIRNTFYTIFCIFLILLFNISSWGQAILYPTIQTPVKVVYNKSIPLIVTSSNIFQLNGKSLKSILTTNIHINDAVVLKNNIWLASDSGLFSYDFDKKSLLKNTFPRIANDPKVAQLSKDGQRIWVGTTWNGSFLFDPSNGSMVKYLEISPLFAISVSPDSSVWFGTNVGMYRYQKKINTFQRYAEEGHSGLELPDNIVQNIFVDKNGNVWVIMTDGVAFKAVNNIEGHLPSFNYVGNRDNVITDVEYLSNGNYLFATSDGLIFLPNAPEEEHTHAGEEIKSQSDTKAFLIDKLNIGAPLELANETVISIDRDTNGKLWFTTPKGIWTLKANKLNKLKRPLMAKK